MLLMIIFGNWSCLIKQLVTLTFSESLFSTSKCGSQTCVTRPLVHQTSLQLKGPEKRNPVATQNISFAFLNESQNRDHDFIEKLTEKEAEREMKSQKKVAKIFKGE